MWFLYVPVPRIGPGLCANHPIFLCLANKEWNRRSGYIKGPLHHLLQPPRRTHHLSFRRESLDPSQNLQIRSFVFKAAASITLHPSVLLLCCDISLNDALCTMQLTTKESSDLVVSGKPRPRPRAKMSVASARSDRRCVRSLFFFPFEFIFLFSTVPIVCALKMWGPNLILATGLLSLERCILVVILAALLLQGEPTHPPLHQHCSLESPSVMELSSSSDEPATPVQKCVLHAVLWIISVLRPLYLPGPDLALSNASLPLMLVGP